MSNARERPVQWKGKLEFLFTEFGFIVGLGNIWRFPYRCYTNGGAVFLIPYLLTVVLCSIPMLLLEISLGQFSSGSTVTMWEICPLMSGIGWAVLFNCYMISVYYIVIVMYALYYMLVSFVNIGGLLPWQHCYDTDTWSTDKCRVDPYPDLTSLSVKEKIQAQLDLMNNECISRWTSDQNITVPLWETFTFEEFKSNFSECQIHHTSPEEEYWNRFVLGVHESGGVSDLGQVNVRNFALLVVIWIVVYYCCIRGIRSISRVIYVTVTFPFALYLLLLLRGITLPGHEEGVRLYTQPDWDKIWDVKIWASATTQAIYNMGLSFGAHVSLSSYNDFKNNIVRDALIIGLLDTMSSILGGFIVFSFIGHVSYRLNRPIEDIIDQGPGILFTSYAQGVSMLPGAAVWSFLFYLAMFTLGLDSQFVIVWTLLTSVEDIWPKFFKSKKVRVVFLVCLCASMCLLGLPLITNGGIHFVVLMDRYTADFTLTIFILLEAFTVCWIYGINNFISDMEMMIGKKSKVFWIYWRITWCVTSPCLCLFILLVSAVGYSKSSYGGVDVSAGGEMIGWLLIVTPFVIAISVGVYRARKLGGVKNALRASNLFWRQRSPENNHQPVTPTIEGVANSATGSGYVTCKELDNGPSSGYITCIA